MISCKDLLLFHREKQQYMMEMEEELSNYLVPIAESPDGDWYSLVMSCMKSTEIKVVLMSHETLRYEREWPSIAEFVYEMLKE